MEYKGVIDKMILVKLTTRQRPQQALNAIRRAHELASNPSRIQWLVSLDHDDETAIMLCNSIHQLIPNAHIYFGASNSKIHAINRDVETFTKMNEWDILLNLSDDQTCVLSGWDNIIQYAMPNSLDASLWFYDGAQPRINTMEIVGRKYYNGFIYHPEYKSFYCDEEATNKAAMLGKLIKNDTVLFRHDHPACHHPTSLHDDALYQKNQRTWDEDKAVFMKRKAINYGL